MGVLAQPPRHLEPVEVGHHDVEQHEVGTELGQRSLGRAAAVGLARLEALVAQGGGDGVGDRRLVVDDEDPRCAGGLCARLRP